MGVENHLINGVSCAGKTTVANELQRRGHHVVHGDRELAYVGHRESGEPADGCPEADYAWIWDVERVKALAGDRSHAVTFFCGGSFNVHRFVNLFDRVFVLEIDRQTLDRRLAARPADQWGGTASAGEAFARHQHATGEGLPRNAIAIDATGSLIRVVDAVLQYANEDGA